MSLTSFDKTMTTIPCAFFYSGFFFFLRLRFFFICDFISNLV